MRPSNILSLNSPNSARGASGGSGTRGYSSPMRIARVGTSPRNDIAPRPPPQTGGSSEYATPRRHDPSSGGGGGSILPVLTSPATQAQAPPLRTPSPNAFKRTVWTTPRSPHESTGSPSSLTSNVNNYGLQTPPDLNSRSCEDEQQYAYGLDEDDDGGYPAYCSGDGDNSSYMYNPAADQLASAADSPSSSSSSLHSRLRRERSGGIDPERQKYSDDAAQLEQLAYMEQMYNTIQVLNAELEKERQDRASRLAAANSNIEDEVSGALEYPTTHGSGGGGGRHHYQYSNPSDFFDDPGTSLLVESTPSTSSGSRRSRPLPSQPKRPIPPPPSSQNSKTLSKDQVELCATLGKNAELRIRTKEMEKSAEKASVQLDQAQKQMKMVERRISNREEKLRILMKEKLHWQKELKDMRDQVVEEKMRQVELFRRLETAKRESVAQIEQLEHVLREIHDENQSLRAQVAESRAHITFQVKKLDEVVRQAREEKEKLVSCIAETRYKFKEWKEGEAAALRSSREQAVNNVKTEYDLKIARHQEEKQKLREKVKDLEVSLRLMQKDRTLSPLELSLRKATILGSKDSAGTSEAELIEAHSRIRELEALMEHSQEYQKRQENIIKVSEATISRLVQEREVTALENLSAQPLAGGFTSPMFAPDANNAFSSSVSRYSVSSSSPNIGAQRDESKRQSYGSVKSPSSHDTSASSHGKPRASSTTNRIQPASSSPLLNAQYRNDPGVVAQQLPQSSSASPSNFSLMTSSPSKLSKTSAVEPTQVERERNPEPRRHSPRRQDTGIHGIHAAGAKNHPAELAPPDPIDEDVDVEGATPLSIESNDTQDAQEQSSDSTTSTPMPTPAVSSKEQFLVNEVARLQKELAELKANTGNDKSGSSTAPNEIDLAEENGAAGEPFSIAGQVAIDEDNSAEPTGLDESALDQHVISEETEEELSNDEELDSAAEIAREQEESPPSELEGVEGEDQRQQLDQAANVQNPIREDGGEAKADDKSLSVEGLFEETDSKDAAAKGSEMKDADAAVRETNDDERNFSETVAPRPVEELEAPQPGTSEDGKVGLIAVPEKTITADTATSKEDELPVQDISIDAPVVQVGEESLANSPATFSNVSTGLEEPPTSAEELRPEIDSPEKLIAVDIVESPATPVNDVDNTHGGAETIVQSNGQLPFEEDVPKSEVVDESNSFVCDAMIDANDSASDNISEIRPLDVGIPDNSQIEAKEPDPVDFVSEPAADKLKEEMVASTCEDVLDAKTSSRSESEADSSVAIEVSCDSKELGDDGGVGGEERGCDEAESKIVYEDHPDQSKSNEEKNATDEKGSSMDGEDKQETGGDTAAAKALVDNEGSSGDPEVSARGFDHKESKVEAENLKGGEDAPECKETNECSVSEIGGDSITLNSITSEENVYEAKELNPVEFVDDPAVEEMMEESKCEELPDGNEGKAESLDSVAAAAAAEKSRDDQDPSDSGEENKESAQADTKIFCEKRSDESKVPEEKHSECEFEFFFNDDTKFHPSDHATGTETRLDVGGGSRDDTKVSSQPIDEADNSKASYCAPEEVKETLISEDQADVATTIPERSSTDESEQAKDSPVAESVELTDLADDVGDNSLFPKGGEDEDEAVDTSSDGVSADAVELVADVVEAKAEPEQITEAEVLAQTTTAQEKSELVPTLEPESFTKDEAAATSTTDGIVTEQLPDLNQETTVTTVSDESLAMDASEVSESAVSASKVPESESDGVSDLSPDHSSNEEGVVISLYDNAESEATIGGIDAGETSETLCLPAENSVDDATTLFFNDGEQFHCDAEEQQLPDPVDPPLCEKLSVEGLVALNVVARVIRTGLHHSIVLHLENRKYVVKAFVLNTFREAIQSIMGQRGSQKSPERLDEPEEQVASGDTLENDEFGQEVEADAGSNAGQSIEGEADESSLTQPIDSAAVDPLSDVDSLEEGPVESGAENEHLDSQTPDSLPPPNDEDALTENSPLPENGDDDSAMRVSPDGEGAEASHHQNFEQESALSQDSTDSTAGIGTMSSDPQDHTSQVYAADCEEKEGVVPTCPSEQSSHEAVDKETPVVQSADAEGTTALGEHEPAIADQEDEKITIPDCAETKAFAEEFILNVQSEAVASILADHHPLHSKENNPPVVFEPKESTTSELECVAECAQVSVEEETAAMLSVLEGQDDPSCEGSNGTIALNSDPDAVALLDANALTPQTSKSGLLSETGDIEPNANLSPESVSEEQTPPNELLEQQGCQGGDDSQPKSFDQPVSAAADSSEAYADNNSATPTESAHSEFNAAEFVTSVEVEAIDFVTKSVMMEQQMSLDADAECADMSEGGGYNIPDNHISDGGLTTDLEENGVLAVEGQCDSTISDNPEPNQSSIVSVEVDETVSATELVSSESATALPTSDIPDLSRDEATKHCEISVVSAQATEDVSEEVIPSVDALCYAAEAPNLEPASEPNKVASTLDQEDCPVASDAGDFATKLAEAREDNVEKVDADRVTAEKATVAAEVGDEQIEACEGDGVEKSNADSLAVEEFPAAVELEACLVADVAQVSLKLSLEITATALEAYSAACTTNGVDIAVTDDDDDISAREIPITCENSVMITGTTEGPAFSSFDAEAECVTEKDKPIVPPANDAGGSEQDPVSSDFQAEHPSEEQMGVHATDQQEFDSIYSRYNSIVRPNSPHEEVCEDKSAVQCALEGVADRLTIIQASRVSSLYDVLREDSVATNTIEVSQESDTNVGEQSDCCDQVSGEPTAQPADIPDAANVERDVVVSTLDSVQVSSSAVEDPNVQEASPAIMIPGGKLTQELDIGTPAAEIGPEESDASLNDNPHSPDELSPKNEPMSASLPLSSVDPDAQDAPLPSSEVASSEVDGIVEPEAVAAESSVEPTEATANNGHLEPAPLPQAPEEPADATLNEVIHCANDTALSVEDQAEVSSPIVVPSPSEETGKVEPESAQDEQLARSEIDTTGETTELPVFAVESTDEVECAPVPNALTGDDTQTDIVKISTSASADGGGSDVELAPVPIDEPKGVGAQETALLEGASTCESVAETQSEMVEETAEKSLGGGVCESESIPVEPELMVADPPGEKAQSNLPTSESDGGIELKSAPALEDPVDKTKNEAIEEPTSEVDTGTALDSEPATDEAPNDLDEATKSHVAAVVASDAEVVATLISDASDADTSSPDTITTEAQEAERSKADGCADVLVSLNDVVDEIERSCAVAVPTDAAVSSTITTVAQPESPPAKATSKVTWDLPPESEHENATPSPPPKSRRTERRRTSRQSLEQSRYVSSEVMRDPTLAAYDAHREQDQPFALLDDNIFSIDPHAQHMQHDENDNVKYTESEILAKRKNFDQDNHRKSIAYRTVPAFNYAPVLIRFQWSDFVVATPISICNPTDPKDKKNWNSVSPVKKMRLLVKKGIKLSCGSYVIISAFIRPLEDGNENLRIHIYDSEWVEEFQYDFFEDHLKEYMPEWTGRDEEARIFMTQLDFRREEGGIIIKLPDKVGQGEAKRPITAPAVAMPLPDGKEYPHHDHTSPQPSHRNSRHSHSHSHRPSTSPQGPFLPLQAHSLPNLSDTSKSEETRHDPDDSDATADSAM